MLTITALLSEVAHIQQKRSYFNLDITVSQAVQKLASLDPHRIAAHADVPYQAEDSSFLLYFLKQEYRVLYPQGKIFNTDGSEAPLYPSIIMLHYLITADGKPLTGEWVSYRHLPGGDIYNGPFQQRAVKPFLKTFGQRPEAYQKAAEMLGGRKGPGGGISMVIPVMPRVPLCFVLWPGDDELPASASILFDAGAASYLHTEDYAHLPAIVIGEMKGYI